MRDGLRPDRPDAGDEPGPHPARLHQGLHQRRRRRGPRRADPGGPRPARRTPRHRADRGHRPRRGRGGHRPVERGRRGDARGAGGHRQRGRRRPADRRDRAQRQPLRGPRRPGRRGDRQQGRPRRPARPRAACSSAAWRRHGIPLLGVLPYRPILSNPTLAMVLEGVRGETLHPGPDLDLVIDGVAIGAMEPRPHARTDRAGHARHRPRRPRGRDPPAHGGALGRDRGAPSASS